MIDRQKEFSGVGPVRDGYELDARSLQAYMAQHVADFSYVCMPWRIPQGMYNGLAGMDHQANCIPTEQEFVESYCRHTGRTGIENWNCYMAFNLFRLAAILFGIMGRIRDGTAASKMATQTVAMAVPFSELGWAQVKT
jgi:aminoglycoside phosphotransferase (APT) family kinase protein